MPDVTVLLDRIKKNIDIIENGNVDADVFDEVRSDFTKMFEMIKLFLISERDLYYGYILMNLQFRVNFYTDCIAGIMLNTYPPVFETNPLLLGKFSLKEIIYIVCHEIDHILFNHPAEMVKSNPTNDDDLAIKFNYAADAAVNDRINNEIQYEKHLFMKSPEGVITSTVLGKIFNIYPIEAMENYMYYFNLIKGKAQAKDAAESGAQGMMDRKEGAGDDGETGGNSHSGNLESDNPSKNSAGGQSTTDGISENDASESGNNRNLEPVTAKNCGQIKDHVWQQGDDAEALTEIVKELLNSSFDMMNGDSRGLMPGYFLSAIETINKPPVLSWEKILKKYVGTISANKRKTRTRLNRRQPDRFDLSGDMNDKVLKIVVAIDTSGSMSNSMISGVLNEVFAILAKRKHDITVIECDSQVQRVYKAAKPEDIKKKVAGRGGTSFTPVIEYINNDKYYRDALLIYFTDGYGERSIPKPMTYRNLWVVLHDERNLSLEEPYGMKIKL